MKKKRFHGNKNRDSFRGNESIEKYVGQMEQKQSLLKFVNEDHPPQYRPHGLVTTQDNRSPLHQLDLRSDFHKRSFAISCLFEFV